MLGPESAREVRGQLHLVISEAQRCGGSGRSLHSRAVREPGLQALCRVLSPRTSLKMRGEPPPWPAREYLPAWPPPLRGKTAMAIPSPPRGARPVAHTQEIPSRAEPVAQTSSSEGSHDGGEKWLICLGPLQPGGPPPPAPCCPPEIDERERGPSGERPMPTSRLCGFPASRAPLVRGPEPWGRG